MIKNLMNLFGYISKDESHQRAIIKTKNALKNASLRLPGDELLKLAMTGRRDGFIVMHINGPSQKYTDAAAMFEALGRPMTEEDAQQVCNQFAHNSLDSFSQGDDISNMTQPAHLWFAAAVQKFKDSLIDDAEPSIKLQIGGAILELNLVGVGASKEAL